jgi:hypothetical protein
MAPNIGGSRAARGPGVMHGDNAGMDDDANSCLRHRWKALGDADALFCRPYLDMDAESARQKLDPEGLLESWSERTFSASLVVEGSSPSRLPFSERE